MGPPGSGKGTQAKKLAEKLGAFYFGTGDLMRLEAKNGTELGRVFQAVFDHGQGELVPDEIVDNFVKEKFLAMDFGQGVIFDGFPRTINQAKFLEEVFSERQEDFIVIDLEVANESLIKRMATRRVCDDCGKIFFQPAVGDTHCDKCGGKLIRRQEDEPEVVIKRLEVYEAQTKPLLNYFNSQNKLISLDGELSIDEVEKNIMKVVEDEN